MTLTNYTLVDRQHGSPVWIHNTKPVWLAKYERTDARAQYFQAYVATVSVPHGKQPWEVPNRRLGDAIHGFRTLQQAAKAGDEA